MEHAKGGTREGGDRFRERSAFAKNGTVALSCSVLIAG